jgi:hypothetical protein
MNADLHRFVRDALERGLAPDAIRAALRDARWPADEVESALAAWHDAGLGLPVPRRRVGVSPREAFLYLLMFVALYLVAIHTGVVLFAWIERLWPDPVRAAAPGNEVLREQVRFAVASLLVAFPVFLLTSRLTGRAVAADPEKRNSGVRRWLTYLTLFNAACVLIGDFISLLLGLLKGELTAPFLAKSAVVGAIAGWLFTHYLGGLRRDEDEAPAAPRPSPWARAAGAAVVLVALAGLWIAGAPGRARVASLDHTRVQHLARLEQALWDHRDLRGALPTTLAELEASSPTLAAETLRDPVTGASYRYEPVDSVSFRLCAVFDAPDSVGPLQAGVVEFWRHGAGEACFVFHRLPPGARPGR